MWEKNDLDFLLPRTYSLNTNCTPQPFCIVDTHIQDWIVMYLCDNIIDFMCMLTI